STQPSGVAWAGAAEALPQLHRRSLRGGGRRVLGLGSRRRAALAAGLLMGPVRPPNTGAHELRRLASRRLGSPRLRRRTTRATRRLCRRRALHLPTPLATAPRAAAQSWPARSSSPPLPSTDSPSRPSA